MLRLFLSAVLIGAPALAVAGANPTNPFTAAGSAREQRGFSKNAEDVFGSTPKSQSPDAAGSEGRDAKSKSTSEPTPLPRDGVTDDILEKYRLKK